MVDMPIGRATRADSIEGGFAESLKEEQKNADFRLKVKVHSRSDRTALPLELLVLNLNLPNEMAVQEAFAE